MVNHVKLEIAIQLAAEKIADVQQKSKNAITSEEIAAYQKELDRAFKEKGLIERGNRRAIEKIINENKEKQQGSQFGE